MHTLLQWDAWIYYIAITLGSILAISSLGVLVLLLTQHFICEPLFVLGFVSGAGLAKLLISPLYPELID